MSHLTLPRALERINAALLRLKYKNKPYREYYRELMKRRVQKEPKEAVGGMWEEIGLLQFNFLIMRGLKPYHTLLDFGCGCLRGGLWFIDYLAEGNYVGIDISGELLNVGRRFISNRSLDHKSPLLIQNNDLQLKEIEGRIFDYVSSFSVFTHMPPEDVREFLQNVPKVLGSQSILFATFFESSSLIQSDDRAAFAYPFAFLYSICEEWDLDIQKVRDFSHPRGQKMLMIQRKKVIRLVA